MANFKYLLPRDISGATKAQLQRYRKIAQHHASQAATVGWPALEQSWRADLAKIEAALSAQQ